MGLGCLHSFKFTNITQFSDLLEKRICMILTLPECNTHPVFMGLKKIKVHLNEICTLFIDEKYSLVSCSQTEKKENFHRKTFFKMSLHNERLSSPFELY